MYKNFGCNFNMAMTFDENEKLSVGTHYSDSDGVESDFERELDCTGKSETELTLDLDLMIKDFAESLDEVRKKEDARQKRISELEDELARLREEEKPVKPTPHVKSAKEPTMAKEELDFWDVILQYIH